MQEEQERQEAIEELQATFMGHQARQPVVKALQVLCSKLKKQLITKVLINVNTHCSKKKIVCVLLYEMTLVSASNPLFFTISELMSYLHLDLPMISSSDMRLWYKL